MKTLLFFVSIAPFAFAGTPKKLPVILWRSYQWQNTVEESMKLFRIEKAKIETECKELNGKIDGMPLGTGEVPSYISMLCVAADEAPVSRVKLETGWSVSPNENYTKKWQAEQEARIVAECKNLGGELVGERVPLEFNNHRNESPSKGYQQICQAKPGQTLKKQGTH